MATSSFNNMSVFVVGSSFLPTKMIIYSIYTRGGRDCRRHVLKAGTQSQASRLSGFNGINADPTATHQIQEAIELENSFNCSSGAIGQSSTGDLGTTPNSFQCIFRRLLYSLLVLCVAIASVYYKYRREAGVLPDWNSDRSSHDSTTYEVVDLPGRGKGMVATRLIRVCILSGIAAPASVASARRTCS
jgi:hypothetical protein